MKIPDANDSSALFAGRVALVTGASHGIGAATARPLGPAWCPSSHPPPGWPAFAPSSLLGGCGFPRARPEGIDCCTALASAGNVAMPALLPVMRAEVIRREVGTAEYETTVAATRARHVSRGRRKGHRCAYSLTAQQPPARR